MARLRFPLLLSMFFLFHFFAQCRTAALNTTRNFKFPRNFSSFATLRSLEAVKTIPLALNYLFYNEFHDLSSIGVYPVRDIIVRAVNNNLSLLTAYNVSLMLWDTKYSDQSNLGITVSLFDQHVVNLYKSDEEAKPALSICTRATTNNTSSKCAINRSDSGLSADNTTDVSFARITATKPSQFSAPLFFGPEYSAEAEIIGRLAPMFNVVTISAGAGSYLLSNKTRYPHFFRTVVSSDSFAHVPRALLTYLNYTTVALANIDDSYGIDPMQKVENDLRAHGFHVLFRTKFDFTKPATVDETIQAIDIYDARVIVIYSNEPLNFRLFCRGFKLLGVDVFNSAKYLIIFLGIDYDNNVITPVSIDITGCTQGMLDSVLNGSLTVTYTSWAKDTDRLDCCNITVAQVKTLAAQLARTTYGDPNVSLSNTLANTLDAFWAGILALDRVDKRLRAELPWPRSLLDFSVQSSSDIAAMLVEEIEAVRFRGALGKYCSTLKNVAPESSQTKAAIKFFYDEKTGEVSFTANGEFAAKLLVRQYLTLKGGTVDRFSFDSGTDTLTLISPPVFGTPDGRPPLDKKLPPPPDNTEKHLYIILICAIGGALILLCCLIFLIYRRSKRQSFTNPSWLIPYDALEQVKVAGGTMFASRASLASGGAGGSANASVLSMLHGMKLAMINDHAVRMQLVPAAAKLHVDVHTHRTLTAFRDKMLHPNLVRFVGYTLAPPEQRHGSIIHQLPSHHNSRSQYLLWEHCEKGSLEHLIGGESAQVIKLDALFEYSILLDVAQGINFIHLSFTHVHGALCTAACLIDKRFSIKIGDYGDQQLADLFGLDTLANTYGEDAHVAAVEGAAAEKRLYWAPEVLRESVFIPHVSKNYRYFAHREIRITRELTRQRVVYSFAVLGGKWAAAFQLEIKVFYYIFYVTTPTQATPEADVYAFAIVVYGLITRMSPSEAFNTYNSGGNTTANDIHDLHVEDELTVEKLLDCIRERHHAVPYRPSIHPLMHCDTRLQQLVQRCWAEQPSDRPTMPEITRQLQTISGIKAGGSVTDQLLLRLERYASDMESLVAERTQELEVEKRRSDELLNAMLPSEIAKQLKLHGKVEPESFDVVTIYFSDIVGFTTLSGSSTPIEVVNLLNALYTMFDAQIDLFDAYKVETIGDAYMVVSGLPHRNGNLHVVNIAKLSLALLAGIKTFIIPHRPEEKLRLRIGLNTGPCVAGVVGIKMPRYCLFGDTVNTASRMESSGEALRIHISEYTKRSLDEHAGFVCEERGPLEIKGKGTMITYWLISG